MKTVNLEIQEYQRAQAQKYKKKYSNAHDSQIFQNQWQR